MARLTGIRLLILGTALWALAVWIFDAPAPTEMSAPTETAAAAETAAVPASTGTTAGTGANEPAGTGMPDVSAPSATASRTSATSPDPGAAVESASARSDSADGIAAVPAPVSAATGDGTRIAAAPASGGPTTASPATPSPTTPSAPTTSDTTGATAEPATGSPFPPLAPGTGSIQESVAGVSITPPLPPHAWFEHPLSRPPLPGGTAADGNPVAGQINAARRAAWEGRLTDALTHYRAAARIRSDLHVVWGEMGNVLWTMGRWSEAAYALEGAATLLARAGELRAASELVPAVESIDPDAAYRVKQLLWAAVQRQSG